MDNEMETGIVQGIIGVIVQTPSIPPNKPFNGPLYNRPYNLLESKNRNAVPACLPSEAMLPASLAQHIAPLKSIEFRV